MTTTTPHYRLNTTLPVETVEGSADEWMAAIHNGALQGTDTGERASVVAMYAAAAALAFHADADGTTSPTVGTLAKSMDTSRTSIQRALNALVANGFLEMTSKATPRTPAHYRLTYPKGAQQ